MASAAARGAKMVLLPEMFNCPYTVDSFPLYAEEIDCSPSRSQPSDWVPDGETSPTAALIRGLAREHGVWLVAGSVPERDKEKVRLFNTCLVASPTGQFVAKHRKVHLFDIDIPGKITFKESTTLTAGDQACI